ncbi:MAG: 3'-5' exonuclease, partial [Devosia sp.]
TNPQQWDVVKALIDDFFSGESAADRPRTLFAVGDQKQSIFSFQGADPQVFLDTGIQTYFSARTVQLELAQVPLRHSFRTLPNILEAVDEVFKSEALAAGVLDPGMTHRTARADRGGSVTLWPPIKELDDNSAPDEWATEPADGQLKGAPRQVAERIAGEIDGWLREGRRLATRDVPIRPDDILILVQVRSVLFHEIIRALNKKAIPTPGADRLAVTTHIGVLDLMALGDVLANVSDDLQLAALLRSPLFDVSEEDLFEVAHGRTGWLWMALEASANPRVRAAYRQLNDWRRLNLERPFDFYSEVLYAGGGLKRMRARFGAEIDDVVAEFLDLALQHENEGQPSLLGFLAELRSRDVTIRRELGESGGVRVMTVHGAKGLEAPIVILADAASTEEGRDRRSIYMAETPLFFHASSKATHAPQTMGHKDEADAAREAEYWRKLYVAMTRAEDELYVTGYLTKARKGDGSWYRAIESALIEASDVIAGAEGETLALIYPKGMAASQAAAAANDNARPDASFTLSPLPKHSLRRIVRPSSAADDAAPEEVLVTDAERSVERDPDQARHEGTALHALLHHLLKLPRSDWEGAALRALPELLPQWPDAHPRLAAKAVSILSAEKHQQLFGSSSRGEVPVLALGMRNGEKVTIAGRIDRLVVEPGKVMIIDYKSDAREPASAAQAPKAYLTQLGLYARIAGLLFPGHAVEAAILWTGPETLMFLPADLLRDAVAGFTIG